MIDKKGSSHSQTSKIGNEMQILQAFNAEWSKNHRAVSHGSSSILTLLQHFIRQYPIDETITAWGGRY